MVSVCDSNLTSTTIDSQAIIKLNSLSIIKSAVSSFLSVRLAIQFFSLTFFAKFHVVQNEHNIIMLGGFFFRSPLRNVRCQLFQMKLYSDRTRIFTHYSLCVSINGWRFYALFVTILFPSRNHLERALCTKNEHMTVVMVVVVVAAAAATRSTATTTPTTTTPMMIMMVQIRILLHTIKGYGK